MTDLVFVDSNVLVYNRVASEPVKQRHARTWIEYLWETGSGRLSFQVLQEFYVIVTAKLKPGLDPEAAETEVRELCSWEPVMTDLGIVPSGGMRGGNTSPLGSANGGFWKVPGQHAAASHSPGGMH